MKNLSLPSNILKALTTTAKGPLNRYRKDAVCDSGATNHFVPESFQGGEEDTTRKGLEVGCANNQIIKSVSTDTLNFTKMNKGSNSCHKFKDENIADPLISIPQLAIRFSPLSFGYIIPGYEPKSLINNSFTLLLINESTGIQFSDCILPILIYKSTIVFLPVLYSPCYSTVDSVNHC
jgi:hypothetical protein